MNVSQSLGSTLADGHLPAVVPNASRLYEHLRLRTNYVQMIYYKTDLYREYGWIEKVFNYYSCRFRESISYSSTAIFKHIHAHLMLG